MSLSDDSHLPALARAGIDRAADERTEDDLVGRLRAHLDTRVVVVHGDRAPLNVDGSVRTMSAAQVIGADEWAFLGRDSDGVALLVAAASADAPSPIDAERWGALRAVGGSLSAVEAGMLVEAVALGRWLVDAPFCPACGGRTALRNAGWSRRCPQCGREHFPRTDPAVIVAVSSVDGDRLLLGKNALWAERNLYSTFAGFVEAGESLESAIIREIQEESGVSVERLEYRGSQAWPYPRSLMLGFRATARADEAAQADGTEIVDVRWFTRDELRVALTGDADFALPGPTSIAFRLISDWTQERP